jgi:DNA-binding transcriptional regulator YiaG
MMVLHEMGKGLFEVGAITEEQMREYDRDCLVQEPNPEPKSASTTKRALASV